MREYFGDRQWCRRRRSLTDCIRLGEQRALEYKEPFTWLTSTNRGAAEVCLAALLSHGITHEDLDKGYLCDPTTQPDLRILAKPGVYIRLSRNFDKVRGFVNGALATVVESLRGNEVFVAKLHATGDYVLVHPMEEDGQRFLPCCYGYATTIRCAQGADLFSGAIYFDQKKAAGRGYGYVAVGRFKSRQGCFLYGRLRRTDFLLVGEEQEDEVLERDVESQSTDSDDGLIPGYAYPDESDEEAYLDQCISTETDLQPVDFDGGVSDHERHSGISGCPQADVLGKGWVSGDKPWGVAYCVGSPVLGSCL